MTQGDKRLLAQLEAEMAQIKTHAAEAQVNDSMRWLEKIDAMNPVGGALQAGGMATGLAPLPHSQPHVQPTTQPTTPMSFTEPDL